MYQGIVFDLDGTLIDTSGGIMNSYKQTLKKYQLDIPEEKIIRNFIGSKPPVVFETVFKKTPEEASEMTKVYRDFYKQYGMLGNYIYPGIKETLKQLKKDGVKLGVATLKLDEFAKTMLEHEKLADYFDAINGVDIQDILKKSDLIKKCINTFNLPKESCLLVGDSENDRLGAKEAGISFVGVTYGFGYHKKEKDNLFIENINELLTME